MAALTDDLFEEIVLRLPPDEPRALVRAALVSRSWYRLVSSARFRRRFREFHGATIPVLGFVLSQISTVANDSVGFLPSTTFRRTLRYRRVPGRARDARHGRVLIFAEPTLLDYPRRLNFAIWNPITSERRELPELTWPEPVCLMNWTAAVLCAGATSGRSCDHLACHDGPSLVVFVLVRGNDVSFRVYSSETGAWSHGTSRRLHNHDLSEYWRRLELLGPSLLVGNQLYFPLKNGSSILSYDISTFSLSRMITTTGSRPVESFRGRGDLGLQLVVAEHGRLGLAGVDMDRTLYLWSSSDVGPDGVWRWRLSKTIQLDKMLSIDMGDRTMFHVLACTEVANTILVCRYGDKSVYAVAVDSGRVKKVADRVPCFYDIIPYVSFHTPGPTLWEIGVLNQSAHEFYIPDPDPKYASRHFLHKDRYRQYSLWERYAALYPENDIVFMVGKNNYSDWFFAHVTR